MSRGGILRRIGPGAILGLHPRKRSRLLLGQPARQPRVYSAPAYIAPAPVYYERPVTYYQPQTVYMQPYQQMRPVYPQTIVYRSEPVIVRESRRCSSRW